MKHKIKNKTINRENSNTHFVNYQNVLLLNINLFSLLILMLFTFIIYFSYQKSIYYSEMLSEINEFNAIHVPYPWQFLAIKGNKYFYKERENILVNEFEKLKRGAFDSSINKQELAEKGKQIQVIITSIAYSFPYKQMLKFNKDGSVTFDPNKSYSIDLNKDIHAKFIRTQINEIINLQYNFVNELKDGKDKVKIAIAAAANINDKYTLSRLDKYIDSLIDYFDNHYRMAVALGVTIDRWHYFHNRLEKSNLLITILILNFIVGIVVLLVIINKWITLTSISVSIITFFSAIIIIFRALL
jgi:hypothetical protein